MNQNFLFFRFSPEHSHASERIFLNSRHEGFSLLIEELNTLEVGSWHARYDSPYRVGIHNWALRVHCDHLKIDSRGLDTYPPGFDAAKLLIQATNLLDPLRKDLGSNSAAPQKQQLSEPPHAGTKSTVQINRSRSRTGSP